MDRSLSPPPCLDSIEHDESQASILSYPSSLKSYADLGHAFSDLIGSLIVLPRDPPYLPGKDSIYPQKSAFGTKHVDYSHKKTDLKMSPSEEWNWDIENHHGFAMWSKSEDMKMNVEENIRRRSSSRSCDFPIISESYGSSEKDEATCIIMDDFYNKLEFEEMDKTNSVGNLPLESDAGSELAKDERNLKEAELAVYQELEAVALDKVVPFFLETSNEPATKTRRGCSWLDYTMRIFTTYMERALDSTLSHENAEYALGYGMEQANSLYGR